jgi:hypothetical protein
LSDVGLSPVELSDVLGPAEVVELVLAVVGTVAGEKRCLKGITGWEDMVLADCKATNNVLRNDMPSNVAGCDLQDWKTREKQCKKNYKKKTTLAQNSAAMFNLCWLEISFQEN